MYSFCKHKQYKPLLFYLNIIVYDMYAMVHVGKSEDNFAAGHLLSPLCGLQL